MTMLGDSRPGEVEESGRVPGVGGRAFGGIARAGAITLAV